MTMKSATAPDPKLKKATHRTVGFLDDANLSDESVEPIVSIVEEPNSDLAETFANVPAITLNMLQQRLLQNHPGLAAADSKIRELAGKKLQAGLGPNPQVGVISDDINANDGAGRYGAFYSQKVIRGGKLQLAQSAICAEIDVAKQRYESLKRTLLIDLQQRYYALLLAQESVRTADGLIAILEKTVATSQQLFEAEEIAKTPVLRSELELENAIMNRRQSVNARTVAARRLAAIVGETELSFESLAGDVRDPQPLDDFEAAFDRLLASHPELATEFSKIEVARRDLVRARAVPIPDVTWLTSVQYDFTTDEIVGGFQVGMPLPKRNRNQGAVMQAAQQIQSARHAADEKVLELRDRLTLAWSQYIDARIQIETYDDRILPKAAEAMELADEGYRIGETPYLELLSAQRLFAETKIDYLKKLQQRWRYQVEIEGLIASFNVQGESDSELSLTAPPVASALPSYN